LVIKFTVKLLLFQETEKEKLLSALHEEGKKVKYAVFYSKGMEILLTYGAEPFPAFYGTQRFITMFTRTLYWSLS
jgi:hypothetical protein